MDRNFTKVKFGDGIAYKLSNGSMKDSIMNKLYRYYHLPVGDPYRKYYRNARGKEDLKQIVEFFYLVTFKINAPRTYLYCTIYNNVRFCFYIHNNNLYSVWHRLDESLFERETLLEGHLVHGQFIVNDLIIYDGHTTSLDLTEKLKILNEIIDNKYRPDPVLDPYQIVLQDHVSYQYINSFATTYAKTLPYRNKITGLVFVPLDNSDINIVIDNLTPIPQAKKCTQESKDIKRCEVVQNPKKQSACFAVRKTAKPDIYEIYLNYNGELCYYDLASIPDKATSSKLQTMFKSAGEKLMICKYDPIFKRWKPHIISCRSTPDELSYIK